MVRGKPHSAQTPALRPLTRVRGQLSVIGLLSSPLLSTLALRGGQKVTEIVTYVRYYLRYLASGTCLTLCTHCHYSCGGGGDRKPRTKKLLMAPYNPIPRFCHKILPFDYTAIAELRSGEQGHRPLYTCAALQLGSASVSAWHHVAPFWQAFD